LGVISVAGAGAARAAMGRRSWTTVDKSIVDDSW
jgi:hypothetical protein